jgi:hypothetical protein
LRVLIHASPDVGWYVALALMVMLIGLGVAALIGSFVRRAPKAPPGITTAPPGFPTAPPGFPTASAGGFGPA